MDADPLSYDVHYWHPDGTPATKTDDNLRTVHGFPTVPGLLDAARRPFAAAGLRIPWYSCFGNHDGLLQGNVPATSGLGAFSTGSVKVVSPPAGIGNDTLATLSVPAVAGPGVRLVTADPRRRSLSRAEVVAEHFTTTGSPVGHGYTAANRQSGTAHYFFDSGPFRFVVMDTVNPNGEADGSLDQAQFTWLRATVEAAARRAVLVFSHHTSWTMGNALVGTGGEFGARVLGPAVSAYLLSCPQVIAWINGHTHAHSIRAHARDDGSGGFWEINTASHIDFPQQARIIEVLDNTDGTWSLFTTAIDHAGVVTPGTDLSSPVALAGWSRELAANDPQAVLTAGGTAADRNVELLVPTPPGLRGRACRTSATTGPSDTTPDDGPAAGPAAGPGQVPASGAGTGTGGEPQLPGAQDGDHLPDTGSPVSPGLVALGLGAVLAGDVLRRRGSS